MPVFLTIKLVNGPTVLLLAARVEAMMCEEWGTTIQMMSGAKFFTSETHDALLERMPL